MTLQELYANPQNWTQGCFARIKQTQKRIPCNQISKAKRARHCYCLLGGIEMCYPEHLRQTIEFKITSYIQKNTEFPNIPTFNDDWNTTIADIQKVVKECNV